MHTTAMSNCFNLMVAAIDHTGFVELQGMAFYAIRPVTHSTFHTLLHSTLLCPDIICAGRATLSNIQPMNTAHLSRENTARLIAECCHS